MCVWTIFKYYRRRKQIWSVEAHAVLREVLLHERNFAARSVAANILASFSDLTNPPVQYSIYVENRLYWLCRHSQETAQLAFVACSSLFKNLH